MSLAAYSYTLGIIELLLGIPLLLFPAETTRWLLKLQKDDVLIRLLAGHALR